MEKCWITTLHQKFSNNTHLTLNYVFLSDKVFTLTYSFLKLFNNWELTNEQRIFNYRLSRAYHTVENVFVILVLRFRKFHTSIM
ncbi:hypothetical protein PR048_033425 [Dryococelus australis]|uniref:DDE Tnp4 domain-containing protein n=1 Tax=Dryococelus australis TaxID=614101 RepID=A0ABQ9G3C7_9NEOP|nr:hypothetical protein PR048_033425 [Dryococelus australis]